MSPVHLARCLALALPLLCGAGAACRGGPNQSARSPVTTSSATSFCAEAHVRLGYPQARVQSCTEYWPDFFWVILEGTSVPAGQMGRGVVVENGQVSEHGGPAAARYLRRIQVYDRRPDGPLLCDVLQALQAFPPGFGRNDWDFRDATTGLHSDLRMDPLTLELVTHLGPDELRRLQAWAASSSAPPAPASPSPSGPSGGIALPWIGRATLSGDRKYRFTWKVEWMNLADGKRKWQTIGVRPL